MANVFEKSSGISIAKDYGRGIGSLISGTFSSSKYFTPITEREANFEKVFSALQVLENEERQRDVVAANETHRTADGLRFGGVGLVIVLAVIGAIWFWKKRKKV